MRTAALFLSFPVLAALAPAQHTILFSGNADERTWALDLPELDLIGDDDVYEVTPVPGVIPVARPFLPVSYQMHLVGDLDNDGRYVEVSTEGPGGSNSIDEIFVKANATAPVSPRDVFISLSAAGTALGVLPSDVFRFSGQGQREVFLTEAQLMTATGGTSLNLDALCQSTAGDLFFSFSLTETLTIGSVDDGDLLSIPASAITYDINGNVAAIAANSTVRIATQTDLLAMINASGFRQATGAVVGTTFDLAGLERDPNGGTWISPVNSQAYPNLLFVWNDTNNDGAIISTSGGGTIAVINGVPMGSTVATQGTHLGWTPGLGGTAGTSGPNGFALIPQQAPQFSLVNYPRNLHTQGDGQTFVQLESSAGTPGGLTIFFWSVEANTPGGAFPSVPAPSPFLGDIGVSAPIVIGAFPNDALGNSSTPLIVLDTSVTAGINLASQALDFTTLRLSTPTGMSFL